MLKYLWIKFEILTPYISRDTDHFVEILLKFWSFCWNFDNLPKNCFCTSMASLWVIYGEKQILRKLTQKSSLMLLWWFECEKVDLTAEIKIFENVLCLEHWYLDWFRTKSAYDIIIPVEEGVCVTVKILKQAESPMCI